MRSQLALICLEHGDIGEALHQPKCSAFTLRASRFIRWKIAFLEMLVEPLVGWRSTMEMVGTASTWRVAPLTARTPPTRGPQHGHPRK